MSASLEKAIHEVQAARAKIIGEIESVTREIARLEDETKALPKRSASFAEIKKGIFDLVDAAGGRYANKDLKAMIVDFAKGAYRDVAHLDQYGKTLTLGELDASVKGEIWPMANPRFLSGRNGRIDDFVLYAIVGDAVKERIAKALDQLTPADLGIADGVGESAMSREEMNNVILSNAAAIESLKQKKADLQADLKKLS